VTGDEFKVISLQGESGEPRTPERGAGPEEGDSLTAIMDRLRDFRAARDWERYHTPRSLAVSIAVEAGELLEQFQWVNDEELESHVRARQNSIREELADVVIYAVQLSDVLGVRLGAAIRDKIELNESRYPVEASRGSASKYTELSHDDPVADTGR
jgi:NTP pyrophosphatase (non-canonical NTP hydrolase)